MLVSLPNKTHNHFRQPGESGIDRRPAVAQKSVRVGLSVASPIRKKFQWKFFPSSWWHGCPTCTRRRARKPTRTGGDGTDTTNKRGITRTQIPDVGDLARIPTRNQIPDVGNLAHIAEVRHAAESRCGQRRDAKTSSGSFSPRHGGEVIHCTTNMTPRPRVVQKSTVSRIHLSRCWPASMAVGCSS